MDTSDTTIVFDTSGICNHCHAFDKSVNILWYPSGNQAELDRLLAEIRSEGIGREFDCILGLSGGVDSSYLALKAKDWGLRPLVVHVDAGWNSELAVSNIERLVKYCGFELHTHVVDWADMRNLQLAYLRSGISNQDVPQDHAFFANLYSFAVANKVRTVLSGGNFATEGVFAQSWHGHAMDSISLLAIHRRFGTEPLRTYRTLSFYEYFIHYPIIRRFRAIRPLNFIHYDKRNALEELEIRTGWRNYGRKHGESIFTKFFQNHYLPVRFGYDKRRLHLSSLILSGQLTREEALEELHKPLYDPDELRRDKDYVASKLRISAAEIDRLMTLPLTEYSDFPNWEGRRQFLARTRSYLRRSVRSAA